MHPVRKVGEKFLQFKLFDPHPNIDQIHEFVFQPTLFFHHVINEDSNWGHYAICDATPRAYYSFWLLLNMYLMAILF